MTENTCKKCGTTKPISEFYQNKRMLSGYLNSCIPCVKAIEKARRDSQIEKWRAYDRARANLPHRIADRNARQGTDSQIKSHRKANERYRQKFPDRQIARQAVNNAIRDGKLFPMPCFVCGQDAEAHHPDYSRPLDVIWLCDLHHKEVHKMARQIARGEEPF